MIGGHGKTLSILVVEDDTATAELVRTVINDVPGWGATVVHDAAAAREVFHHIRGEELVLEGNRPGISGLESLELLRQDEPWNVPPAILLSGKPNQPGIGPPWRAVRRRSSWPSP